jgi:hypothetical protein
MLTISAQLDSGRLLNGIRKYAQAAGVTVQFACYDTMRLWLLDLVWKTAPWGGKGVLGSYAKQRATGKGAVEHDIDKIYAKFEPSKQVTWTLKSDGRRFVKNKETGAVIVVEPQNDMMKTDAMAMRALHMKYRNRRGRVKFNGDQVWVKKSAFRKYVKSVQARVGSLKAGWLNALNLYARLSSGSTGRIPNWIKNQAVHAGSHGGNMDATGNGTIYATNDAHHWKAIQQRTVVETMRVREKDLRGMAMKRIQRLVNQFNSGHDPHARLKAA